MKEQRYLTKGDFVIATVLPKASMAVGKIHDVIEGDEAKEDILVLAVELENVNDQDQDQIKQLAAVYNNHIPKYSLIPVTTISQIILLEKYNGN